MGNRRDSYLDHSCSCSCSDNRSCRTDIEKVIAIPACPDDVDYEIGVDVLDRSSQCAFSEDGGCGSQELGSSLDTVDVECSEECADLRWVQRFWGEEQAKRRFEIVRAEVFRCFHQPLEECPEDGLVFCRHDFCFVQVEMGCWLVAR